MEEEFQEKLGTRVHIDRKELGGQIKIDFFSTDDLRQILESIQKSTLSPGATDTPPQSNMLENHIAKEGPKETSSDIPLDDRSKDEIERDDTDLYNISNFSV